MKKALIGAAFALTLAGASAAHATLLYFDFSFSDDRAFAPMNVPGTVTGEITGLTDNATSAAAHVLHR